MEFDHAVTAIETGPPNDENYPFPWCVACGFPVGLDARGGYSHLDDRSREPWSIGVIRRDA